jgi:hypothetical protein
VRWLPDECSSRADEIPAIFTDNGLISPRAKHTVVGWLAELFRGGYGALEFASRDTRFPAGNDGRYYLVFRVPKAGDLGDVIVDAIQIVVFPGRPKPIEWIGFMGHDTTGLDWIGILADFTSQHDGKYHQVLTR